jgi:hypothetical protein
LNRALPCIRIAIALTAIAVVAAGCAGGNNATSSQASAQQGEQPYKTMYGISSEGTTTDLYTEMFGSRQASSPATNVAAAQPVQSVTSQPLAPVQVAQQPAPPSPPPEPDVPTAYGITANGPTTDLYTAIFGPRRSDGR